jgi:hypothetical protein
MAKYDKILLKVVQGTSEDNGCINMRLLFIGLTMTSLL